jgi:cobalt-zinc-cadmium efflux system protein
MKLKTVMRSISLGQNHAGHDHAHVHTPANFNRAFAIGVTLNILIVVVQAVYGYFSHSLALMADAGHNLSDVLGLLLAWGAAYLATKKPSRKFTYGLRSSSILAALTNAIILLIAIGAIAWEAVQRFSEPHPVESNIVIIVAIIAIVANGITAMLFMSGRKSDLNLRGAYLHMLADTFVSVGVVVAGLLIKFTGAYWIDPLMSLIICATIVYGTWGLLKDSVNLALHAVPETVDEEKVFTFLKNLKGVSKVHDLHIWGMSTTQAALTAHLVMPEGHPGDHFIKDICHELEHLGICHTTVQIESGNEGVFCKLAPDEVV